MAKSSDDKTTHAHTSLQAAIIISVYVYMRHVPCNNRSNGSACLLYLPEAYYEYIRHKVHENETPSLRAIVCRHKMKSMNTGFCHGHQLRTPTYIHP